MSNAQIEGLGTSVSDVAKGRFLELVKVAQAAFEIEVRDIFVSETRDAEGKKTYQSLWLFCDEGVMECKNPLASICVDFTPFSGGIRYAEFSASKYDSQTALDDSTLTVQVNFGSGGMGAVVGLIHAVGSNCDRLLFLVKKWFIPRLTGRSQVSPE